MQLRPLRTEVPGRRPAQRTETAKVSVSQAEGAREGPSFRSERRMIESSKLAKLAEMRGSKCLHLGKRR